MAESFAIEPSCMFNREGYCAYFLPEYLDAKTRQKCFLCWHWVSGKLSVLKMFEEKLKKKKSLVDFWDLMMLRKHTTKLFGLDDLKPKKPDEKSSKVKTVENGSQSRLF